MKKEIFKTYDIRGIYPDQLNEDSAYKIARAFVRFLEQKTAKKADELEIITGRDMRISSPSLYNAYLDGVTSSGAKVFDAGLIAIDQMYFSLGNYNYDGGAMITASHNPKEYNGMKMYLKGVEMISADDIQSIRKLALEDNGEIASNIGLIEQVEFDGDYSEKILSMVSADKIKPLKVVLDAGNGMGGRIFPLILDKLSQLEHMDMYFELDGAFPNHEPNPERLENTHEIQQKVVNLGADFGAAFDGDADRVTLIDDKGEVLRGDIITGLLAKYYLQKNPGSDIVYNVLCTSAVRDVIRENGGNPVRWKTGHTHMKAKMRELNAVFGGEMSGHLFFKDFYFAESATLAFLVVAEILSQSNKKLSELAMDLKRYAFWSRYVYLDDGELPESAIKKVRENYENLATSTETIDGYTFYFENPDWWFNVRPSNTEPRIALTIESKNKEFTQDKKKEILEITGGKVVGD